MKLRLVLMLLLPLCVRMDEEEVTCFSCSVDEDCTVGVCVDNHCTNEFGLFANGCNCGADVECSSGSCRRVCEHTLDMITTCTRDADCIDGFCNLHARCVTESHGDGSSESGIMPFWMAVIGVVGAVGAFIAFLCVTRKESCSECCCEGFMSCLCILCEY